MRSTGNSFKAAGGGGGGGEREMAIRLLKVIKLNHTFLKVLFLNQGS